MDRMVKKNEPRPDLSGKRALVTGGSRGIGASIVEELLTAGAKVVTTSRNPVKDLPDGAHYVQSDLGAVAGADLLAQETLAHLGGLDILVNNAASGKVFPGGITTFGDADWQSALDTTFLSAVHVTSRLLPALTDSDAGTIVNISSGVTHRPIPPLAHYAAAKAALEAYSKALAVELAPKGVRVNVVTPGDVATPGADLIRQTIADAYGFPVENLTNNVPLGRVGVPQDIAEAVLFLVSARAAWVTGSELVVDGGALTSA
jgi:NAD(P)-dependent dehydrogenase (short-subunit alcohol dehydrogenase family)